LPAAPQSVAQTGKGSGLVGATRADQDMALIGIKHLGSAAGNLERRCQIMYDRNSSAKGVAGFSEE
jgi:hypothetical protein